MQEEINVIDHLLAVEKNAAVLIDNAVKEADGRIIEARNKANSQFKEQYDDFALSLQKAYEQTVEEKKSEHNKKLEAYKRELENFPRDYQAFDRVLDGLLSEK